MPKFVTTFAVTCLAVFGIRCDVPFVDPNGRAGDTDIQLVTAGTASVRVTSLFSPGPTLTQS